MDHKINKQQRLVLFFDIDGSFKGEMYMCTVYVGSVMSLLAFGFFASYGRLVAKYF